MLRLSGPDAVAFARRVFRSRPPVGVHPRRVQCGVALDGEGAELDAALAWVLPAPGSYTGEDTVEITTHGSDVVLERLLDAALGAGAQLAGPGEFTRRAFLNGRLDLTQAEAVVDLIQASGTWGVQAAYGHLRGHLSDAVRQLKDEVVGILAWLEAGLDFAGEDVPERPPSQIAASLSGVMGQMEGLVQTFEGARRRQDGRLVALVGRPNVGKSTLLNALLGEERAIVTSLPGTTRDLVEGRAVWAGQIVRLVDTAGLRSAPEAIEAEGVARARGAAHAADVVLAVYDGSCAWTPEDAQVAAEVAGRPVIVVVTKCDLPRALCLPPGLGGAGEAVEVSGLRRTGLGHLRAQAQASWRREPAPAGLVLTRSRHRDLVGRACQRVGAARQELEEGGLPEAAAAALHGALADLGALLGEAVDESVLDRIFSEFCIGK